MRGALEARDPWPHWPATLAVVVGVAVTIVFTLLSHSLYNSNEKRLLQLRSREVATVISQAEPTSQTPLSSASALADATDGNPVKFRRFITPYVGSGPPHPFVSVSLWRLDRISRGPLLVVGRRPSLAPGARLTAQLFARAARSSSLSVIGLRSSSLYGLGYAVASRMSGGGFVAYAENLLPPDRHSRLRKNQAFSDLDYAIYLGPGTATRNLLVTSVAHPPLRGTQAKVSVPFGDTVLTTVVSPHQSLAGSLPERLPWIIAIVGAVLTAGAAALALRLTGRRRRAEQLAAQLELTLAENQRLYAEQRTIAQTLQHALLPEALPEIPGAEAGARYEPGERGVEIGGDWYDMILRDDQRLLVVVGDVSGRGLAAGTTMASLRYAIHAYAAQDDGPEAILAKLAKILNVVDDGQLATVLCAEIDVASRTIELASAGHLPPLLISGRQGRFLTTKVGLPIGVERNSRYTATTVEVPAGSTFLAFTDGLVERRGEDLDRGLARLRETAIRNGHGLPELLNELVTELRAGPSEDDTAVVGLRWKS